jgi:hypothetical protein
MAVRGVVSNVDPSGPTAGKVIEVQSFSGARVALVQGSPGAVVPGAATAPAAYKYTAGRPALIVWVLEVLLVNTA